MLQIKVTENYISYKKLSGCACLSLTGVERGARKIAMFEILICTETRKLPHKLLMYHAKNPSKACGQISEGADID